MCSLAQALEQRPRQGRSRKTAWRPSTCATPTYPYDIFHRLEDIRRQAKLRLLDGLIHYTQTFCFRQMQDLALRQSLNLPLLTLEGDRVGSLDTRARLRLEAFLEVLA